MKRKKTFFGTVLLYKPKHCENLLKSAFPLMLVAPYLLAYQACCDEGMMSVRKRANVQGKGRGITGRRRRENQQKPKHALISICKEGPRERMVTKFWAISAARWAK